MITILRSRFQPFTKYHWEAIKPMIFRGEKVALCIIRDYETISRWYDKKTSEVEAEDFRHLPIFNPLTTWNIVSHINESLCEFMKKDGITHEYWSYKTIHLVFSPLKFSELVEGIASKGDTSLVNLKKLTKGIQCPCEISMRKDCLLEDHFGKLLSIISYDSMPLKSSRWLFPIFDVEDENDYLIAINGTLKAERIPVDQPPKFEIEGLTVGLYGEFILWIYLSFLSSFFVGKLDQKNNHNIPPELRENLKTNRDNLKKILKKYLADENQWDYFDEEVGDMVGKFLSRFEGMSLAEKNLLLNFHNFKKLVQKSVQFQGYL